MMEGGLSLRKICGQKECPEYYMCLEQEWQCDPCSKYCEKLSDYYDYKICERHCQDYIHDSIIKYSSVNQINEVSQSTDAVINIIIVLIYLNAMMFIVLIIALSISWTFNKIMMYRNPNIDIQLENISTEQDPDNDIHVLHDKAVLSKVTVITENSPNVSEIDKEMEEFVEYNNLSVSPVVVHKSDPKPVLDPVID